MKKIMYIPLDERPCNYNYISFMLEDNQDIVLLEPPLNILGNKKSPANFELLSKFILENISTCYGLVISIDMLLYGGIVPSRLHNYTNEDLKKRLSLVNQIKDINPSLKIYAFSLIMRCPQYNSGDEEPDYYEFCGYDIFKYGEILHKKSLNVATEEEILSLDLHYQKCKGYYEEYLNRRAINVSMNIETIKLLKDKVIDFLVFPQDDSSLYGLIALDQQKVASKIKEYNLEDIIPIYPGADEVGMVLVSRMINHINNKCPRIYVEYSTTNGHLFVPMLEDRPIYKTIIKQLFASGCKLTDDINNADGIFMFNNPTLDLKDANTTTNQCEILKNDKRNIADFVNRIANYINANKKVSIADVAKINRGDKELVYELCKRDLFFKLSGYAGWNTSSNTLGTALTHLVININYGSSASLDRFLALRVYEDIGYMDYARSFVNDNYLPNLNLNYFDSGDIKGSVSQMVFKCIDKYILQTFPSIYKKYQIVDCYMPWKRMFEVALLIKERKIGDVNETI